MDWENADELVQRRHAITRSGGKKVAISSICAVSVSLALLVLAVLSVVPAVSVYAAPDWSPSASASCDALARQDPTATNGKSWGRTVLPGHGAPGGWFGVDVCDNGVNVSAPGGANVSCDRVPSNWAKTGCTPGGPTSDGYGWTFQCVELVVRFSAWAYGDRVSDWGRSGFGNAPDLWLPQNHPADFIMYSNGSDHAPVPGDILVWGNVDARGQPWPAGRDGEHGGHIAVVAAVRNGMVITAEQNVKWGSEDHPSDTLALTKVGSRWILSGSTQHETHLPTYRWLRTMGTTRATYGWLHSIKNHGVFPSTSTPAARTPAHVTPKGSKNTPKQASGGLPSLAAAVVVTKNGTLADVVWSQSTPFSQSNASAAPHAELRSLGAPPTVRLVPGQTPGTVPMADGSRYSYVVGTDGHLYVARTGPGFLGVLWTDLGTPESGGLVAPVSATAYAGGVGVAALSSDGNLWWRAGPAAAPGGWQSIGHPGASALAGFFAIASAPGSGMPLLLALGEDGLLYERVFQPEILADDGSVQVAAGWSSWISVHSQPAGVRLVGPLLVVPEVVESGEWAGSWRDAPLDVVMADSLGRIWWLRSTTFSEGWVLNTVPVAFPISALVAGVVVPARATKATSGQMPGSTPGSVAAELDLYALTAQSPYEARIAIPAHPHDLIAAPTWTTLSRLPSGTTTGSTGTALALGVGDSSLLVPQTSSVLAGGIADATTMLVSPDGSLLTASGDSANAWIVLGMVATAPTFADPLDTRMINPQWVEVGDGAAVVESSAGLRMIPGAGASAALLQSMLAGDASMTVRVQLPKQSVGTTSAGLILYLDGGDWLTLTVRQDRSLSLCVESQAKALPCVARAGSLPASAHSVWLRVIRHAITFTGMYSLDGQSWMDLGQWTAGILSSRASGTTTTATPGTPAPTAAAGAPTLGAANGGAMSLAFTECGMIVSSSAGLSGALLFSDFSVVPASSAP